MLFADDIVLCCVGRREKSGGETGNVETSDGRQGNENQQREDGVSRYVCVADEETVEMQAEDVKSIENFKYLGSTVQKDGGVEKEVAKRVQVGWGAWRKITGVMCDGRAPAKVKGKLYKTMVQPAMTYAMEMVAVTNR